MRNGEARLKGGANERRDLKGRSTKRSGELQGQVFAAVAEAYVG